MPICPNYKSTGSTLFLIWIGSRPRSCTKSVFLHFSKLRLKFSSNFVIKFRNLHFQNCFTIKVLLPRFFSTFKSSFSYGEGCLVLQSLVVFIVKSTLCVIHDENDPSKVDGSFNIIANVGLISLLALCSVPYVPLLNFINNSNVFYLTGE